MQTTAMKIQYIDTLAYVKKAKKLGEPEALAEYQARQIESAAEMAVRKVTINVNELREDMNKNHQEMATRSALADVARDVIHLQKGQDELMQENGTIKHDIVNIKQDIVVMKSDIVVIKEDIVDIKQDIRFMKQEFATKTELKLEIGQLENKLMKEIIESKKETAESFKHLHVEMVTLNAKTGDRIFRSAVGAVLTLVTLYGSFWAYMHHM